MFNKYSYPLALLKGIDKLNSEIKNIVEKHKNILFIEKDEGIEINIKHQDNRSGFFFLVSKPKFHNGKCKFLVSQKPKSTTSMDTINFENDIQGVISYFNAWISQLLQYSEINLTSEEKIFQQYENEFYENFELIDEDANEVSYDLERQLIIYNFISETIKILEKEKGENQFLIEDAKDIYDNLQNLTKKNTVERLSKLFAKIRKHSLNLLKEVLLEARKELYKRAIGGGFDFLGDKMGI